MEFNAQTIRKIAMEAKEKNRKKSIKELPEFITAFDYIIKNIQEDILNAAEKGLTDIKIRFARSFQDETSALFANGKFFDTPEYMLYEAVKTELSNLRFNIGFAINTTNKVYDIVEFKIAW